VGFFIHSGSPLHSNYQCKLLHFTAIIVTCWLHENKLELNFFNYFSAAMNGYNVIALNFVNTTWHV